MMAKIIEADTHTEEPFTEHTVGFAPTNILGRI